MHSFPMVAQRPGKPLIGVPHGDTLPKLVIVISLLSARSILPEIHKCAWPASAESRIFFTTMDRDMQRIPVPSRII
jgi:hypothetical protein